MTKLHSQFRAALLDPEAPTPTGLRDGQGRPAAKRFDVYRNNVTVALIEALRTAFPVLHKLLGTQNFDQLARLFVRAHPPETPLMMHYGGAMPAFLEGFAPLSHIAYLPDVSRLELALRRSYHAADAPAFDPARLGVVTTDVLMASTLTLAPAVELVRSPWPLVEIWRYNTAKGADKPRSVPQSALITRTEFDPVPHALDAAQVAWITQIRAGATLAAAQDAASAHDPDFDLTPLLSLLIQTNAIADLTTPKE
ncbi:DNA-binding domain-containing protein [uncultured Tateyamaria sp.]|uniref:HvfC/BufC N-terminal domain-containing protein n=1 Tax=uncultured Tateyamaria sp. TaxID=455651 RepID=UPI002636CAC4|nr:DNA-binding domain-containing protein [uncultured Tateyamaria sp.]